ncbi:MAG: glycosyl transferase [Ignavibacteriales bacterium CG12_big_fil_rev_8_21_14_0_65_30_8]|nr:MAG: glycosyl transferase [Ignavibacteriales bacterium CG12_big_fil_rev_8_21_14_0_65_30_8]
MFEIIFLILIVLYFIQSFIFFIGVQKRFPVIDKDKLLSATVLVAARNEEKNILKCLESLDKIIYPNDKLEILIVDDRSTDRTGEIIESFIKDKPIFKKIISKEESGKLKGKTNALACGIKEAKGEIIFTTDADCIVKPSWVIKTASYYKENIVMVNGFTTQIANSNFSGMQSIDFIYLLMIASSTINLGKPISCIGNNMSYLKKAYLEVGGYEALPFSVTEDFNLLMAISKLKKYKIIYPLDQETLVTSIPCKNFKELYRQKKRWAVGGLGVPFSGFIILITGYLTYLCLLLLPFFYSTLSLFLLLIKIVIDYLILFPIHKKLGIIKNMKYFFVTEIYFTVYVLALPFLVLFNKKVKWKGREF